MELKKTTSRKYKISGKHIALSAVFMFLNSTVVMSAEWAFEPSVVMSATQNDNFRFAIVEESVSGMQLHPKIKLSRRTRASEIMFSGQAFSSRYDNSRYDSDEIMLDFGSFLKNTERSTIRVNAGISRRTILSTEIEDSGRFGEVELYKDRISFNPSWEYQWSSSSLLQVSYSGQDADYNGSTSHTDYQYHSLVGSYSFRQSEKNQYGITLLATRYDPNSTDIAFIDYNCNANLLAAFNICIPDPAFGFAVGSVPATSNITDSVGFNLGITRNFSQTLSGNVSIGLTRSENTLVRDATQFEIDNAAEFGDITPTVVSTGIINKVVESTLTTLEASLTKNYELTSITVRLNNSLRPSSNGSLNEITDAALDIKHNISQRLKLSGNLKATSSQTQNETTSLNRDYYTAGLKATWNLTKWWRLGAEYLYRQQRYDIVSDSTDSNQFTITLNYAGLKKSISR
ncbi:MAG: outer membrane beta-barrel protein [Gammaproteobacteria bacterium]|nr:outer membrane beta-barrel protein [Gammaproteobacteria bacterium]